MNTLDVTKIYEIKDSVGWRDVGGSGLEYLCVHCKEVIYVVNPYKSTLLYKEELINIVNTHLSCCPAIAQEVIKLPTVRMIRV